MHRNLSRLSLAAALLTGLGLPPVAQTYGHSDGTAEQSLGYATGGDIAWFQSFDTGEHSLSLDDIVEVGAVNAFGYIGSSGGVAVYQDPANDALPFDLTGADLRASATWTVASAGGVTFERVQLCPNAQVTGKFWIAVWASHGPGDKPAPIDLSEPSNGRSWTTGHLVAFDPNQPNAVGNVPWSELSTMGPLFDGVWVLSGNHDPMTIFVDKDAFGSGDGSSWSDAMRRLQDAVCLAQEGDEIWVAEGRYRPDRGLGVVAGDRTASFVLKNEVSVLGGFDGTETSSTERDWEANRTVLSGDLAGDDQNYVSYPWTTFQNYSENACSVVRSNGSALGSAVLDGFHVRGGYSTNSGGCGDRGAGAKLSGAPTVRNCVFRENFAWVGGAMMLTGAATIENTLFQQNRAYYTSGAIIVAGSAADPWLENCTFLLNTCDRQWGGAMMVEKGASATVVNGLFSGNFADDHGGAIHVRDLSAHLDLRNSTLAHNVAYGNAFSNGGGLHIESDASAHIANSILFGNTDGGAVDESAQLYASGPTTVESSLVQGWTGALGGSGNRGGNPRFKSAYGEDGLAGTADDDLRLRGKSPCIDAGADAQVPAGTTTDLDGNARIQHARVDMGAYECKPAEEGSGYEVLTGRGGQRPMGIRK